LTFEAQVKENFDRFNFAIHKEKEMPVFRRWILALAGFALFAGLASAQAQNPFTCNVNNAVPPTLRTEGLTELSGDIVLVCAGGTPVANGAQIPQATFQIFMNGPVTSRLLGNNGATNASEAMLMIDEPGSGLSTYGASLPLIPCNTPLGGCVEYVGFSTAAGGGVGGVPVNSPNSTSATVGVPVGSVGALAPAPNVFQGLVSGQSITFAGIPVQPPVSAGATRIFRITNIRVSAQTISGGSSNVVPVVGQVSISGATSIAVSNATLTTGFIEPGLASASTGLRNSANIGGASATQFAQCSKASTAFATVVQFGENFTTAFKSRCTSNSTTCLAPQNVPGTIYNSESNFIFPTWSSVSGGVSEAAGQADYGTRLKAAFSNVPAGVSIFVSTTNIINTTLGPVANPGAGLAGSYAVLVGSETQSDGFGGGAPQVQQSGTTGGSTGTLFGIFQIPLSTQANGTQSGTAVWEVINTLPQSIETMDFAVWLSYTANPNAANGGTPSTGAMNVNLSFAPTESQGAYTLANGSAASASLSIPRFANNGATPTAFANVSLCQTALLFPFITNTNGFDTGIAIANTSLDPFGTSPQAGGCTLNWFSGGSATPAATPACATTPTAPNCVPNIAAGAVYTGLASTIVNGFQGYMIAVCNFQFAHGFAFISDLGARNLAMGYLALVLPNPPAPGAGTTRSAPESLNN
jgi:hypothetical protein